MPVDKERTYLIAVSVRELVEYSCRSGDLDLLAFSKEYTLAPLRIHQWIQRHRPAEYESEVSVSTRVHEGDLTLDIKGRIDGVYTYPDRIIIDEIKTTFDDPENADCSRIPQAADRVRYFCQRRWCRWTMLSRSSDATAKRED